MVLTNWGYSLTQDDALADFITTQELNEFTANRYAGDVRIGPNISAATDAIRNYCGWHIYPARSCNWVGYAGLSRNMTRNGSEVLIQLPARFVSGVMEVLHNGHEITGYICDPNGLLHLMGICLARYDTISVTYMAGVPSSMMNGVKELTAHRVTHALASSYGVTSESAGGVSVTYNAGWAGQTRSTALADDNKDVLAPFKLLGVF